jgi:ADP-heptose:LPS heptosyltransferase
VINLLKKLLRVRKHSNNILIIGFKFLGDTIFTFPALLGLIEKYKNHNFIVLCSETNKILFDLRFKNFEYIIVRREEIELEKLRFNIKYFKICYQARKLAPEITLDLTSGLKSSLISFFSGAELIVGFGNRKLKSFYDIYEIGNQNKNMTEMFLIPVRKLIGTDIKMEVRSNSTGEKEIKNILITPFAGWEAKEWSLRKYIELGTILSEKYKVLIVSERDKLAPDVINELKNSRLNYKTTNSLSELIEEIKNCDLFIGNDSGPLYISNLLQKPVFAIFGPTNPKFHSPVVHEKYSYILEPVPCSPAEDQKLCFTFGGRNGCPAYECMNQLSVDKVYSALIKFISEIS